jgi:hypothetical protein
MTGSTRSTRTRTGVRDKIEPFIRKYHIDMNEFEPVNYRSFTQFFDRRFWPRVRKFPSAPGDMGARGGAPDEHAHSDIEHVGILGYASAIRVGRDQRVTGFPGPEVAHRPPRSDSGGTGGLVATPSAGGRSRNFSRAAVLWSVLPLIPP